MCNLVKVSIGILFSIMLSNALAATTNIQILSAVVKDQKIMDAEVILQKNGENSAVVKTNANGMATITSSFSDRDAGALIIVKKPGYSTLVAKCPCNDLTYAISPIMLNKLDGLRVVLTWGQTPKDLDSHTMYQGNHVFFRNKVGANANLDVDDVDSFGPETITIDKKHFGEKYVYAVHDYTDLDHPDTQALSNSNAQVFVYIGESLIRSYYVPKNKVGNLWVVFAIDEQGEFHDINEFQQARRAVGDNLMDERVLASYLGQTTGTHNNDIQSADNVEQVVAESITSDNQSMTGLDAKQLNTLGEQAYHAGKLDQSIDYYRAAIAKQPDFGQAYSNLGLSYQKSNRIAESIWANRKAIALANGDKANVTRANSYYNIARIYEAAGQFADAEQQYELANRERPQKTYQDAIARMKAKIAH